MRAAATNRTQETVDDAEDCLTLYLNDISRVPLLTAARELELGKRIAEGDEAAARLLVESNLRLVVHVVRSYHSDELSLLDLIQEGNLGLLHAARKFDYRLGYRFSTYAIWWIRQAVTRAIHGKGRVIYFPAHAAEGAARMRRAERRGGFAPELPDARRSYRAMHQPSSKIIDIANRLQQPLSLDGNGKDQNLIEAIEDDTAESPQAAAERYQLREQLDALVTQLPDRLRTVVELRFGLRDGRSRTLQEVAGLLHLSRERIRQMEALALEQLRLAGAHRHLHSFLE